MANIVHRILLKAVVGGVLMQACVVPAISQPRPATAPDSKRKCLMNVIQQSKCMIEAILADIANTYQQTGGGGIGSIVLDSTNVYTVSILQEERIDTLTYELNINTAGTVRILRKSAGALNP
ncbi:MAG: hypothetical protein NTZ14_16185 [Hyphomicrobiales bacterium]|nr:hypothetical protein [Hyphomicrobiales bacterium]